MFEDQEEPERKTQEPFPESTTIQAEEEEIESDSPVPQFGLPSIKQSNQLPSTILVIHKTEIEEEFSKMNPSNEVIEHNESSSSKQSDDQSSVKRNLALNTYLTIDLKLNETPRASSKSPSGQGSAVKAVFPILGAPPPKKKKREFNLFLPVAVIEKQEKEIPLCSGNNSQKKKENVFNFYDNFHEYTVFCDVAMKKCSRENQEDRFSAINPLDPKANNDAFFAVFDGHGTSVIADTLKESLHSLILKNENYPTDVQRAVKESFSSIDSEILNKQKENSISSGGSTALCCLIRDDKLYIINCGDSSCVLVDDSYHVSFLNKLHKPSQKEEQERMIQNNTLFTQSRVIGTLAVTRAIGDYQHKEYIISEPDITEHQIDSHSKYCLLGTDGFWDIIDYQRDLPELLRARDTNCEGQQYEEKSLKDLSTYLVENASNRKTNQKKDNMTLLAIDLAWFYRQFQEMKEVVSINNVNNLSFSSAISSNFIMCQKSQFKINTEISSYLFQAKSPCSVGRGIEKSYSQTSIASSQKYQEPTQPHGGPPTSKKVQQKRMVFSFEEDAMKPTAVASQCKEQNEQSNNNRFTFPIEDSNNNIENQQNEKENISTNEPQQAAIGSAILRDDQPPLSCSKKSKQFNFFEF